jgi:hypothetical protein
VGRWGGRFGGVVESDGRPDVLRVGTEVGNTGRRNVVVEAELEVLVVGDGSEQAAPRALHIVAGEFVADAEGAAAGAPELDHGTGFSIRG